MPFPLLPSADPSVGVVDVDVNEIHALPSRSSKCCGTGMPTDSYSLVWGAEWFKHVPYSAGTTVGRTDQVLYAGWGDGS